MRDDRVTIAKAIGILLMVAAHGGTPEWLTQFIGMFHMPLFFFMSGYCFKEKYLSLFPSIFLNKRLKGLYLPYVKWALLFLLLHNVFYSLDIYNDVYGFNDKVSYPYTWKDFGERILRIVLGMHGHEQLLGGYWFLPQLLYASVLGFFIIKYIRNTYISVPLLLAVCIISSLFNLHLPFWRINSLTMLAALFFLAGFVYKKRFDNWNGKIITMLFTVTVAYGSITCPTTMLHFSAWQVLPYFICAVCGTIMTLNISRHIAQYKNLFKRLLVYIGDNTITILT